MRIALDFDDTVTLFPSFWLEFVSLCKQHEVEVCIVTARHDTEANRDEIQFFIGKSLPLFFTAGKAKKAHCQALGEEFDVWIDDNPWMVHIDIKDLEKHGIEP